MEYIDTISKQDALNLEVCYQASNCQTEKCLIKTALDLNHIIPSEYTFAGYGDTALDALKSFNIRDSNQFMKDYFGKGI